MSPVRVIKCVKIAQRLVFPPFRTDNSAHGHSRCRLNGRHALQRYRSDALIDRRLPAAKPGHKPCKAQHRDDTHGSCRANSPSLHGSQSGTARSALELPICVQIGVGSASVQPEFEAGVRTQISRLGRSTDTAVGVDNHKRILRNHQRVADSGSLVVTGVPGVGTLGAEGHVLRQGPCGGRGRTRGVDIDRCGGALEVGVIPSEGDVFADSVELGDLVCRRGSEHHDATGGICGGKGGVCCTFLGRGTVALADPAGVEVGLGYSPGVKVCGRVSSFSFRGRLGAGGRGCCGWGV